MNIAVFDHCSVCVPSSCCLLGNKAQFTEPLLLSRWWFVDMFLQCLVFLLRVCLRYHPPSSTLLAWIGASAFAFYKYPHKPYIF